MTFLNVCMHRKITSDAMPRNDITNMAKNIYSLDHTECRALYAVQRATMNMNAMVLRLVSVVSEYATSRKHFL